MRRGKDLLRTSPKRLAQSRGSLQSNEIVIEEVNDYEISNEAFMLIRDNQKSGLASSMHESSLNEMKLLIDGDLNKLQHTGSLQESSDLQRHRQQ